MIDCADRHPCLVRETVGLWALLPILLLAFFAPPLCRAQTAPAAGSGTVQGKPVVVDVSGEGVPLPASSASVTVLTRAEIEDSHASDLADLLRSAPFLHIAQNGSAGSLTSVTIRGGKPNFTLVLIDGTPVNDITNTLGGSVDLSSISTDNVERIEIVRGPLSSLYGSEAVSGVINVITRNDSRPSLEIATEGGNFGTEKGALNFRGGSHSTSYGFGGSYLNVSNQVKDDAFALGTLTGDFKFEASANKLFRAQARYQHDQDASFPINGGGPELSILQVPELRHSGEVTFGASFQHQADPKWLYSVDFNLLRRGERSNTPAVLDRTPPTFQSLPAELQNTDFRRLETRFSNQVLFSQKWTGHFLVSLKDENGLNDSLIAGKIPTHFHLDRPAITANGEVVYSFGRLTASAGTGVDKSSGFNPHPATRAGANLRLFGGRTTLKGTWASAYQLPSMFALADPIVGNRNLQPEQDKGFDAGVEQRFGFLQSRASISYFRNSFSDLVDFSAAIFKLVNLSSARTQGTELSFSAAPYSKLRLTGDASYLDWQLRGINEPLRDVPHWEGGVSADWTLTQKLHLLSGTRWVGRRFDFSVPDPQVDSVGGYSTTRVAASYAVSKRMSAYTSVDNLLNRRYHEFLGFPNPGIYARVGVKYQLWRRERQ